MPRVIREKHISLEEVDFSRLKLVVNMSGYPLPSRVKTEVETWDVDDPVGSDADYYREVRDLIEPMVMNLVLRLGRGGGGPGWSKTRAWSGRPSSRSAGCSPRSEKRRGRER